VFEDLRERDDSPELAEVDYEGVTIWTTDEDAGASSLSGNTPAFSLATATPVPSPVATETTVPELACVQGILTNETPAPTLASGDCEDDPFDSLTDDSYQPTFDCGGFGYNADGTPNEDAFGGEPCESDAQYCLWWGFVPTGFEILDPYTTDPCVGTSSYCGSYAFIPLATPAPDGLPCGSDFDFWFEEPTYDEDFFDDDYETDDGFFDENIFDNDDAGENIFTTDPTPDTTAIAFVDNVLVLGGSVDDVKSVIDVVQGRADSAVNNERLQEFRAHQKDDFLVWGYVDLADVWAEAEDGFSGGTYEGFDTEELFEQIRTTYDRVGFSLSSFSEGFAFDLTVVHSPDFDQDNAFEPTKAYDPAIAEMLPDDTMFYVSMFDYYNQTWLPLKKQLGDVDLGEDGSLEDILDELEDETGIDLESDVFALLTGEIAIAGNVKDFDDPELSGFAIADVANEAAAEDTLDEFEEYLEGEDVLEVDIDGDVHTWIGDSSEDRAAWYIKDGRFVVGFPIDATQDLSEYDGTSLAENADWKRTLELLPEDKTFVGYLSIARILEEIRAADGLEENFEESTDGEVKLSDLEPIRSIGMSGTSSEDGFGVHFVLFMKDN
jgi:hypothetical protein